MKAAEFPEKIFVNEQKDDGISRDPTSIFDSIMKLTSFRSVETILRLYHLDLGTEARLGQDVPVGVDLLRGVAKGHFLLVVRRMKQPSWEITHPY